MPASGCEWLNARVLIASAFTLCACAFTFTSAHANDELEVDESSDPPVWIDFYGNLDAAVYRSSFNGSTTQSWRLNGLRDSFIGIGTPERETDATHFVGRAELGFGADRGNYLNEFNIEARQVYAGLAGGWGQLTVGRQYNVMTNIGWTALNPLDGGWGIYANDPLYFGDTFTYGNKNSTAIANAGSNWFFGYLQQAAIYQYSNKNFSLEFDYVPGDGAQGTGAAKGAGGSAQLGPVQLSAAIMRQDAADGSAYRQNNVVGGVWTIEDVKLYLSKMQSRTSLGATYDMYYTGVGWQARKDLSFSFSYTSYKQNDEAMFGNGTGNGLAFVASYNISQNTLIYLAAVLKKNKLGDDGSQDRYSSEAVDKNIFIGFSRNF